MLSCLNLALNRQGNSIFKNFSLSLLPGSIYILKGANGSGKTSLLKTISGLTEASNGEVLWNNRPSTMSNIAYLGHENAIKSSLTVIDNLSLWASLKDTHMLVMPAMAQFKLLDIADTKCKDLSAGWLRRVALARMVISNARLWLLDEPEANLDSEGRELLLKLLQVKIGSGGMALIASHSLEYYQKIPVISIEDFK